MLLLAARARGWRQPAAVSDQARGWWCQPAACADHGGACGWRQPAAVSDQARYGRTHAGGWPHADYGCACGWRRTFGHCGQADHARADHGCACGWRQHPGGWPLAYGRPLACGWHTCRLWRRADCSQADCAGGWRHACGHCGQACAVHGGAWHHAGYGQADHPDALPVYHRKSWRPAVLPEGSVGYRD